MPTNPSKDRASLCTFTFADGRQCRIPRRNGHPYLCTFHARQEARAFASEEAGEDIAFFLSGNYVSAGDLSFALSRLFAAVAQGQIKPKTAATLAFLGQTLVQTLQLSQNEYISAFGTDRWESTVAHNFQQSGNRQCPPQIPSSASAQTSPKI
jgi:Tfp pilus assembly protein PilF